MALLDLLGCTSGWASDSSTPENHPRRQIRGAARCATISRSPASRAAYRELYSERRLTHQLPATNDGNVQVILEKRAFFLNYYSRKGRSPRVDEKKPCVQKVRRRPCEPAFNKSVRADLWIEFLSLPQSCQLSMAVLHSISMLWP